MTENFEQLKEAYLATLPEGGDTHRAAFEALYAATITCIQNDPNDEALLFLSQPEFKEFDSKIHAWLKQRNTAMELKQPGGAVGKNDTTPDFNITPGGILVPKDTDMTPKR